MGESWDLGSGGWIAAEEVSIVKWEAGRESIWGSKGSSLSRSSRALRVILLDSGAGDTKEEESDGGEKSDEGIESEEEEDAS